MEKYEHIFGVDVSKKTVDITHVADQEFTHRQFFNNEAGMNELLIWLKECTPSFDNTLFCMEATGLYCFPLTQFLAANSIDIWIEDALRIKRSAGLIRGKNDKIDSERIAAYATKNLDKLQLWKPVNTTLQKIRHLAGLRDRLIETKKRLETPIKEFEAVGDISMAKLLTKSIRSSLTSVDKDIKNIESKIIDIVNEDDNLKSLYRIITSVVGIGFVTAINLLIHTNGFTVMKDVRKLACYCGVAPFEYSSGSSIKGKTKVSHFADKKMKALLNMAALSAKKADKELSKYYLRKTGEGKNPMLVMNAIRCKIISRVFAVITRQTPFVNTQKFAA